MFLVASECKTSSRKYDNVQITFLSEELKTRFQTNAFTLYNIDTYKEK